MYLGGVVVLFSLFKSFLYCIYITGFTNLMIILMSMRHICLFVFLLFCDTKLCLYCISYTCLWFVFNILRIYKLILS